MAYCEVRINRVIRKAYSPKPLDYFKIFCLKTATDKSEALPSRSGSRVHFQGHESSCQPKIVVGS